MGKVVINSKGLHSPNTKKCQTAYAPTWLSREILKRLDESDYSNYLYIHINELEPLYKTNGIFVSPLNTSNDNPPYIQ